MVNVSDGPGELKLEELVSAIEDAVDTANLLALGDEKLRDLEMRLASVCGLLGCERMALLDPEPVNDFGDALMRDDEQLAEGAR